MDIIQFSILALLVAFGAIGVLQWGKSVARAFKTKKGRTVTLATIPVAALTSFTSLLGVTPELGEAFKLTWVVIGMMQLGYELVIQTFLALIRRLAAPPDQGGGKA